MKNEQLTEKEQKYLNYMLPNSGVLYLMGRPGEGKTAIIEQICKKTNRQFIDIRLSQCDETDIGLFPVLDSKTKMVSHAIPEWALKANTKPTIILFDELNRSRESIRNAALQILNEKRIGYSFKFNSDVLMVAAGNLGDEDGTSVDEFDSALWNRLIPVKHELSITEWEDGYAKDHVYDMILSFIKSHPEHYYKKNDSDSSKQFASPRSWTFLSDRLLFGNRNPNIEDVIVLAKEVAVNYVGISAIKFIQYLEDQSILNINNIIDDFDKYENKINKLPRSRKSDLLTSLKEIKFSKLTEKEFKNVVNFLKLINEDERVSFIIHIIDNEIEMDGKKSKIIDNLLNIFKDDMKNIKHGIDSFFK